MQKSFLGQAEIKYHKSSVQVNTENQDRLCVQELRNKACFRRHFQGFLSNRILKKIKEIKFHLLFYSFLYILFDELHSPQRMFSEFLF